MNFGLSSEYSATDTFLGTFSETFSADESALLYKVILSAVLILSANIVSFLLLRVINRRIEDVAHRHNARKMVIYCTSFFVIVFLAVVWRPGNVGTLVGLLGAGLIVAMGRPLLSMAGWVFILIRHPFVVGDRIQVGKLAGDVIDIRLFTTTMLEIGEWVDGDQSTFRVVHLPNAEVFFVPVHNYTADFGLLWNEISVTVTFESDWRLAEKLILETAEKEADSVQEEAEALIKKAAMKYSIVYKSLTPIVYKKIVDFGVQLTLRYLTGVRRRRSTADELTCRILDSFNAEPGISFAYPTYRLVSQSGEMEGERAGGTKVQDVLSSQGKAE